MKISINSFIFHLRIVLTFPCCIFPSAEEPTLQCTFFFTGATHIAPCTIWQSDTVPWYITYVDHVCFPSMYLLKLHAAQWTNIWLWKRQVFFFNFMTERWSVINIDTWINIYFRYLQRIFSVLLLFPDKQSGVYSIECSLQPNHIPVENDRLSDLDKGHHPEIKHQENVIDSKHISRWRSFAAYSCIQGWINRTENY